MVFRTSHSLPIQLPAVLVLLLALLAPVALAGAREEASKMFNRLNGVPPSAATLDAMAQQITAGNAKDAALTAINDPAGMFYNLTLVNLVAQWTNVTNTPRVDLNDYTATVIGMVRDDVPFNTVLSADLVYVADPAKVPGVPAYSLGDNAQYLFLQTTGADLHSVLVQQQQSAQAGGLPPAATAGVLTTRGFGEAFFKDGTNRRAASFTYANFLCANMNQLADTTRPDFRVRRDVTRAPGGDTGLYHDKCAGCHAGMDAQAGAFAHYDMVPDATTMQDTLAYTQTVVVDKFNRNADQFPAGFVTADDAWINLWTAGQNASIGWHGAASGNGAKSWGQMVTDTDAFASCMATQALTAMCLHAPAGKVELDALAKIATDFKTGYSMKNVFAEAAATCAAE